jgi:hypothetical protein
MLEGTLWGSILSVRTESLKFEILLDQYEKICNIFSEKGNISAIFCSFSTEDCGYITTFLLWIQEFRVRILT